MYNNQRLVVEGIFQVSIYYGDSYCIQSLFKYILSYFNVCKYNTKIIYSIQERLMCISAKQQNNTNITY